MFWILKRGRLTTNALLNVLNNNVQGSGRCSKRSGYDRLSAEDEANVNVVTEPAGVSPSNTNTMAEATSLESCSETESSDFETEDGVDSRESEEDEEDSDYESLTCNVCDRSFPTGRQLAQHQQKKRHFGCSACDSLFPSLMALEHHKEEFEHWSGDETVTDGSEESETDEEPATTEEKERLL